MLKCTQESIFWHEIGHLINKSNKCFAIMLENIYRRYKIMPLRCFDDNHLYDSSVNISVNDIKNLKLWKKNY
jgi:hypothetical protein